MDSDIKKSMFGYYDERAEEYEELYLGKGPASIPDPDAYKRESEILAGIVREFSCGELIDIACGTGFWLPHYAPECSHITLIDQSEKMLSVCERKISFLGIQNKCTLVCGDFFEFKFDSIDFDMAIVGFFVSHLTEKEEKEFFEKLRSILKPESRFLIFDSVWNEERTKTRKKKGQHQRKLNNGRAFNIYKRYFDKADIGSLGKRHNLILGIEHIGSVFIAASGRFS